MSSRNDDYQTHSHQNKKGKGHLNSLRQEYTLCPSDCESLWISKFRHPPWSLSDTGCLSRSYVYIKIVSWYWLQAITISSWNWRKRGAFCLVKKEGSPYSQWEVYTRSPLQSQLQIKGMYTLESRLEGWVGPSVHCSMDLFTCTLASRFIYSLFSYCLGRLHYFDDISL